MPNTNITRITATTTVQQLEKLAKKTLGSPQHITIATERCSRGVHITLHENAKNNGLHVIITHIASSREDRQMQGRAGRYGAAGSTVHILDLAAAKDPVLLKYATASYLEQQWEKKDRKRLYQSTFEHQRSLQLSEQQKTMQANAQQHRVSCSSFLKREQQNWSDFQMKQERTYSSWEHGHITSAKLDLSTSNAYKDYQGLTYPMEHRCITSEELGLSTSNAHKDYQGLTYPIKTKPSHTSPNIPTKVNVLPHPLPPNHKDYGGIYKSFWRNFWHNVLPTPWALLTGKPCLYQMKKRGLISWKVFLCGAQYYPRKRTDTRTNVSTDVGLSVVAIVLSVLILSCGLVTLFVPAVSAALAGVWLGAFLAAPAVLGICAAVILLACAYLACERSEIAPMDWAGDEELPSITEEPREIPFKTCLETTDDIGLSQDAVHGNYKLR